MTQFTVHGVTDIRLEGLGRKTGKNASDVRGTHGERATDPRTLYRVRVPRSLVRGYRTRGTWNGHASVAGVFDDRGPYNSVCPAVFNFRFGSSRVYFFEFGTQLTDATPRRSIPIFDFLPAAKRAKRSRVRTRGS